MAWVTCGTARVTWGTETGDGQAQLEELQSSCKELEEVLPYPPTPHPLSTYALSPTRYPLSLYPLSPIFLSYPPTRYALSPYPIHPVPIPYRHPFSLSIP
eukprot:432053-Rhodomonas_salina.2